MPKLRDNTSTEFLKCLIVGDPGSGKTGGLTSLVKAGYKLYIYDFDNLLGSLFQYVRKDCPDMMDNVLFQTFTDKMKSPPAPVLMIGGVADVPSFVDGVPSAYTRGLKQMNRWVEDDVDIDIQNAGPDSIMVVDSLTSLAQAAFRYAKGMNPMAKEPRSYYFTAQQLVMNCLSLLASDSVKTNVIVLAHIDYDKNHLGLTKGFPRSIGSAINDVIAGVFNSVLQCQTAPDGKSKQVLTESTGIVELKNPVAFKLKDKVLPIETGFADFFAAVKEG